MSLIGKLIELTGKRFGRLTVLERAKHNDNGNKPLWKCKCDCGKIVVVRGQEHIARLVAPVAQNTEDIQQTYIQTATEWMDKDEHAMFVDALPKQQRMLMQSNCLVLPFFRQKDCPLCQPVDQSSLNYFASAWAAVENILLAATAEGLACAFRIPIGNEPKHVKRLVNAPEDYEFTYFLAIGYPAPDAHICKQKAICVEERIHRNAW